MEKSNKILYSIGGNDEWKTPAYAVRPLLKYIGKDKVIWCPFDIESKSEFVKVFREAGYKVICSHISTGQDFFEFEPNEHWDIIVSNPPFTNKRAFFERALSFNKPFALLMSNTWLNDSAPKIIMGNELELLMFWERINYMDMDGNVCKKGITFSSSYFCKGVLPRAIICESLKEEEDE